jgi:hypothetical protein
MPNEEFGRELRKFMRGLIGERNLGELLARGGDEDDAGDDEGGYRRGGAMDPGGGTAGYAEGMHQPKLLPDYIDPSILPEKPDPDEVELFTAVSSRFEVGQLLVTVQKDNSVVLYDPESNQSQVVCSFENTPMVLWRAVPAGQNTMYCCMSGSRWPQYPGEIAFGQRGAIFHVEHGTESMRLIPGSDELIDPCEIVRMQDGSLLVVDMQGFGGTAAVYRIDPESGEREVVTEGEPLREACSATVTPGGDIYVANAYMGYKNPLGPAGQPMKDTGALLRIGEDSSDVEVVYDESDRPRGAVCGVACVDPEGRFLVVIRNDWPSTETSAVLRYDVEADEVEPILEASVGQPGFFTHATMNVRRDVTDGRTYVADSFQKVMHAFDVPAGEHLGSKPIHDILGSRTGMLHACKTAESIRLIQEAWVAGYPPMPPAGDRTGGRSRCWRR